MNKLFTKIAVSIASFAMIVGVGTVFASTNRVAKPAYAADASWQPSSIGASNGTDMGERTIVTGITATGAVGTNSNGNKPKFYNSSAEVRFYVGNTLTIASSIGNITSITLTKTAGGFDNNSWSGSATSVSFTGGSTTTKLTKIEVTYSTSGGDTPTTYTVTYSPVSSSGTGTGTITDTNSPYQSGAQVTVKDSTGFTAPQGKQFSHWHTTSTGAGGTNYNPGDKFNISTNTTLYAQWEAIPTYTVTYDENGGTSGSVPVDDNSYISGNQATVLGNSGSLSKTGYTWKCWNTRADGTGTDYSQGDSITISGNVTLYARWLKDYSNVEKVDITGLYLNLPTSSASGYTSEQTVHADDGMDYVIAPSSGNKAYAITSNVTSGTDYAFDSTALSKVFLGRQGAYLYNKDPFQRNIEKVEIYSAQGCSKSVNVSLDLGTTIRTESHVADAVNLGTQNHVYTFADNQGSQNFKFFRLQVTNDNNANVQIRITFHNPTTSVVVSPKSVTLAPNDTQQLTTTVLPANTTDSLVYSSGNNEIATVSNSGLITAVADGVVTITATSGSQSDTCVVTVETPTNPFVNLGKNSVSGYSGQNDNIPFTYGNFNSLSIVSSDEDVATVEEPVLNAQAGTGTVRVNFVAGGNTTVLFKNGSDTLASATVSVTQVTLTLNKNSTSIMQGGTETLVATHNADEIDDDLFWESDNDKVEVNSFGVVDVANDAVVGSTATITVTSFVDDSVYAECVVTVIEHPLADYLTASSIPSIAIGSNTTTWGTACSFTDFTGAKYDARFMGANTASCIARLNDSTNGYIYTSKIPSGMRLKSVSISAVAVSKTVGVYAQLNAFDGAPNDKNLAVGTITSNNLTYTFANNTHYRAICLRGHDSATDIGEVTITYESYSFVDQTIESTLTTSTQLAYHYESDGDGGFEYSNISIRFGGLISKDLWNSLNTLETITGFGVMITTYAADFQIKDNLDCVELAENDPDINSNIIDYYMPLSSQLPPEVGDNYVWNLFHRVDYSDTNQVFMAVAYIKCGDEYVFFRQVEYSVKTLAADYILNRGCDDTTADGSLYYLAD